MASFREDVEDEVSAFACPKVPSRVVPFLKSLFTGKPKKGGVPLPSSSQCIEAPAAYSLRRNLCAIELCVDMELDSDDGWERDFLFHRKLVRRCAIQHRFWGRRSALALRSSFDPRVGTFDPRDVYIEEG